MLIRKIKPKARKGMFESKNIAPRMQFLHKIERYEKSLWRRQLPRRQHRWYKDYTSSVLQFSFKKGVHEHFWQPSYYKAYRSLFYFSSFLNVPDSFKATRKESKTTIGIYCETPLMRSSTPVPLHCWAAFISSSVIPTTLKRIEILSKHLPFVLPVSSAESL